MTCGYCWLLCFSYLRVASGIVATALLKGMAHSARVLLTFC